MATVNLYARSGYVDMLWRVLGDHYDVTIKATWDGNHTRIPPTPPSQGDLLVSCHWPRLFTSEILAAHTDAVNLHPNLSLGYKVEDPVGRALQNGRTMMSVACHRMTEEPDEGEILAEHWRTIPAGSSREYAYELLRPLYVSVLREGLTKL